jgi:hypothetical protein
MKRVTLNFDLCFNPKVDKKNEFNTVEKFFDYFYVRSITETVVSDLHFYKQFAGPEASKRFGYEQTRKTADGLSEQIKNSISYNRKLTAKGNPSKNYAVQCSFDYHDDYSVEAIKTISIDDYVTILLVRNAIKGNKEFIEITQERVKTQKEKMDRFVALHDELDRMLKKMQKTLSISYA